VIGLQLAAVALFTGWRLLALEKTESRYLNLNHCAEIDLTLFEPDAPRQDQLFHAVAEGCRRIGYWGDLPHGVSIRVHPFRELGRNHRFQHNEIHIYSPATWGNSPNQSTVDDLLTHELTHALVYQIAARGGGEPRGRVTPRWFSEGIASVTADEGYRRLSLSQLLHGEEDLHSSAHWSFCFLLDTAGRERVARILAALGRGEVFEDAFKAEIGVSSEAFLDVWRREGLPIQATAYAADESYTHCLTRHPPASSESEPGSAR
jgi:hypothetical protein